MTITLRPYQQEAIDAVLSYWRDGGGNPLVDLATGLGKSVVIAKLTRDLLESYPTMRVLMLVHVRELVEQNFRQMLRLWPAAPIGINSAGLGRRDLRSQILFASVQSVYREDAYSLGERDLVLVDEAHLLPASGDGMYRQLLAKLRQRTPDLRVAGFTATPFRMDTGRLDGGDDALFTETVYSYGIAAGIRDGYLSPLISKASLTEIDVSSVAKRGGEFVPGALEAAADRDQITQAAAREILAYGENRRSWLVFCAGVDHAHHVRDAMRALGVSCETVTGETPAGDRTRIIAAYRAGQIRCLTNANVLTTGFDAPTVDLIAFLRPTLSTGLYVQMTGRGTRLAERKQNCLILDFAGNIRRHGPVDTVEVRRKSAGKGEKEGAAKVDDVRAKKCPDCESLVALRALECSVCGHEWPKPEPRHEAEAARDVPILSTERVKPTDLPVITWRAGRWQKQGSPDSVRVEYFAGFQSYSEWVCPEHGGYAAAKFERWWALHGGLLPAPATAREALDRWPELAKPDGITVKPNGKWHDIVGRRMPATGRKERVA